MRKITAEAVDAFYSRKRFRKSNTKVVNLLGNTTILQLHNNNIAYLYSDDSIAIDSCGWNTPTTRERLSGLKGVVVRSVKGCMVLNERYWDGKFKKLVL